MFATKYWFMFDSYNNFTWIYARYYWSCISFLYVKATWLIHPKFHTYIISFVIKCSRTYTYVLEVFLHQSASANHANAANYVTNARSRYGFSWVKLFVGQYGYNSYIPIRQDLEQVRQFPCPPPNDRIFPCLWKFSNRILSRVLSFYRLLRDHSINSTLTHQPPPDL